MDLKTMQDLVKQSASSRAEFQNHYDEALRYYSASNDIANRNNGRSQLNPDGKSDPLRRADNRVSSNFYQLMVDQEAGYLATTAPTVDVGKDRDNELIAQVLGDDFGLTLSNTVVESSNAGRAWWHYWVDRDGHFRYALVPADQITPFYATNLDNKLLGVLRSYKELDPATGKYYVVHEYWNDQEAQFFKQLSSNPLTLEPYERVTLYDATAGFETGVASAIKHGMGRVPFIEFPKNQLRLSELHKTKGLIDAYDDIYNGFLNDLDDVQQVVLVLKNFGGTKLDIFMEDLKKHKAIKFNTAGAGDQSGVDTLQIDIPTEARTTALQITKSNIFLYGQGVDPANFESSNASGVAIKMLYSHLELKASITEANFRHSISDLTRAIMRYLGISDADSRPITQTWTRTRVEDDLSRAQVVATVANFTSKKAISKANPIVTDWQQELKDEEEEKQADPFAGGDADLFQDDQEDKEEED
ncbi:phage portal protein [Lactobacillus delbrueckii subsp. bulgaricus]|nr:portal protein [Lactobacillus delbrueckii subsp. bulgaricus]